MVVERGEVTKPERETVADPASAQSPASNTAAVLTLAAMPNASWIVRQLRWSYDGTPTGGSIIIGWSDGGVSYTEKYYITSGGPGFLPMNERRFPQNQIVTITLAAGGAGVSGSIYADIGKGY